MLSTILIGTLLLAAFWLMMALATINGLNRDLDAARVTIRTLAWDRFNLVRQVDRQQTTIRHMTITHDMLLDQLDGERVEWARQVLGAVEQEASDV